jgi:hypothetical protein
MEASARQLTEARIREILAGMPAFHDRLAKLGRTKDAHTPVPLPSAADYPPASSVADVVAPYFSDNSDEVAFYQDVMRLQELWTYVNMAGSARGRIDAAIASLRLQTAQIIDNVPDPDMATLFDTMISSRIAQLESVTDDELYAVKSLAPEVEKELFQRAQGRRWTRSEGPGKKRKET